MELTDAPEPAASSGAPAMRLSAEMLRRWGLASVIQAPGQGAAPAVPSSSDERANGLAFSDNGRILVSSHNDGTIRILNGDTGESGGILRVKDHGCKLITATHHEQCFLHAAQLKPTEEAVGTIAYHSFHDNSIIRYFKGHTQSITSLSMSPTSDVFLSASRDGTYRLWDLRAAACQACGSLESSAGYADGPIVSFDNSGRVFAVVTPMRCESSWPRCPSSYLALPSSVLHTLVTLRLRAALALFNAGDVAAPPFELTKYPLLEFSCNPAPIPGRGAAQLLPPRLPQRIAWTGLEFSPDDRFIALATSDRGVLLVDSFYPTRELALLQEHAYDPLQPSSISFSPDGHFLTVGEHAPRMSELCVRRLSSLAGLLFPDNSVSPIVGGADGHVFAYDLTQNPPDLPIGKTLASTDASATREFYL
jgi:WD40 repeat protein